MPCRIGTQNLVALYSRLRKSNVSMPDSIDGISYPAAVARKPRRLDFSTPRIRFLRSSSEKLIEFSLENEFQTFLYFEKRRTQRSKGCFVLLLLELSPSLQKGLIDNLIATLRDSMRETDIAGWHKTGAVIGIVFTEVDPMNSAAISEVLLNKTVAALTLRFPTEIMRDIRAKVTSFPEHLRDERQAELHTAVG